MRRASGLLLTVFLVTLTMSTACKTGTDAPDLSKLGPSSAATTTILPVGSPTCTGGGIGIYTGSDSNGNGVLETLEILKGAPVCDPMTGAGKPGNLVSLVMIASEPTGTVHCPAGGLEVLSGADANKNGVLDAEEVVFTEYLCNGAPGASSRAGIVVAAGPAPAASDANKKAKRPAPSKKQAAVSSTVRGKAAGQSAPQPASANKVKGVSANAVVPQGWTTVKVGSPQIASVVYKFEGRSITVRFTNLSTSPVRFKYTVRWKANQNGNLVDDSTMEGIGFRLGPQESLDREVRTQTQDVRDVVVDLDVVETS